MTFKRDNRTKWFTFSRTSTRTGTRPASITSWIWVSLPAVMLDSVQAASFWMLALSWHSRAGNMSRAPALSTHWVCSSVPVTMFPTERSAGVWRKAQGRGELLAERVWRQHHFLSRSSLMWRCPGIAHRCATHGSSSYPNKNTLKGIQESSEK